MDSSEPQGGMFCYGLLTPVVSTLPAWFASDISHFAVSREEPVTRRTTTDLPELPASLSPASGTSRTPPQAFLSLRVSLARTPDVYDVNFMCFLRYGNEPQVTKALARHVRAGCRARGISHVALLEQTPKTAGWGS